MNHIYITLAFSIFISSTTLLADKSIESLQKQLESKANTGKADAQTKQIMNDATENLRKSNILKTIKKVGDKAPDFLLPDIHKNKVSLAETRKKGPVVVTFYRGGWCPYCNIQLRAYQKAYPEFKKRGATLIAISPDVFDEANKTSTTNALEFLVLTDKDNTVAKSYGLTFEVPETLKTLYKKFGIDLEKSQENNKWELPIPATYVIGSNGSIEYVFADVDYKKRAETKDLLLAIDKIAADSKTK